jgi:hypothetical protein
MNTATNTSGAVLKQRASDSPARCSICAKRLGKMIFALEDTIDASDADHEPGGGAAAPATLTQSHTWSLCKDCYAAVEGELQRAQLQTAYRVRIALGIVASERGPQTQLHFWQEQYWDNDKVVQRWLWWTIMIIAFGHMAVFLVVMTWSVYFH